VSLICRPETKNETYVIWIFRFGLKDNEWDLLEVQPANEDQRRRITGFQNGDKNLFENEIERAKASLP
jgi:hypothetical protein